MYQIITVNGPYTILQSYSILKLFSCVSHSTIAFLSKILYDISRAFFQKALEKIKEHMKEININPDLMVALQSVAGRKDVKIFKGFRVLNVQSLELSLRDYQKKGYAEVQEEILFPSNRLLEHGGHHIILSEKLTSGTVFLVKTLECFRTMALAIRMNKEFKGITSHGKTHVKNSVFLATIVREGDETSYLLYMQNGEKTFASQFDQDRCPTVAA